MGQGYVKNMLSRNWAEKFSVRRAFPARAGPKVQQGPYTRDGSWKAGVGAGNKTGAGNGSWSWSWKLQCKLELRGPPHEKNVTKI